MRTNHRALGISPVLGLTVALGVVVLQSSSAQRQRPQPSQQVVHALNLKFNDLKWQRMVPELGDRSSEITILRVDSTTQATQLMIRVAKNFHVPTHWHTANETHTVLSGTFIIECEGQRVELGPGSFNYVPSKMPHEAWTNTEEGALLFITCRHGVGHQLGWRPAEFAGLFTGSTARRCFLELPFTAV